MFYDKSYQQVLYQHHRATAASAVMQHQQQQRYDALRDWNLAQTQQQQQQQIYAQWPSVPSQTAPQSSQQRPYSGVEQLLMAAMMEGNYHPRAHQQPTEYATQFSSSLPQRSNHFHHQNNVSRSSTPPSLLPPPPPPQPPHQPHSRSIYISQLSPTARDYLPTGRGLGHRPHASGDSVPPNQLDSNASIDQHQHSPTPRNSSELGLYKLLECANLLDYFGTFLFFGGDDVQQLSDADEDEFMEIMDLVGMTKKPLHIRRLQRALANWRKDQNKDNNCDKQSEIISCNFKRPNLDTHSSSSLVNRCSSPCDSRRSTFTSATVDTSQPPTPKSTSSQSFLMIPSEEQLNLSARSFNNDNNLTNQEHQQQQQQPHVLINAPKRIRLFNPTQMNRDRCKTT